MTVAQVMETIFAAVPGFDRTRTVDTLKAGSEAQAVTGVVTTFVASVDVLTRAAAVGANLVITHEPTYYDHLDVAAGFEDDPQVAAKRAFIRESGLAVWRCHDAWHQFPGDGILAGMAVALGWQGCQDSADQHLFHLPAVTLDRLAADIKAALKIPRVRVVGRPELVCGGAYLSPGCPGWQAHRRALCRDEVDVLVAGEGREWETCEYVRDLASMNRPKGMIILGHCNSEEAGMAWLAEWLRPRLGGIPVSFLPAGDPFRHL